SGSRDASLSLILSQGHSIPRRRTHDGTVRSGESVPALSAQVLGVAARAPAWSVRRYEAVPTAFTESVRRRRRTRSHFSLVANTAGAKSKRRPQERSSGPLVFLRRNPRGLRCATFSARRDDVRA